MAVAIVHGTQGMKSTDCTMEYLRGFDIILTTLGTICAQIVQHKKAFEAMDGDGSAKVPGNGYCLVGIVLSGRLTRDGYAQHLELITS